MLVATSDRSFGPSRLRSVLVLERRFRAHFVERDRLVYDTRFAARAVGVGIASLYLVVRGNTQLAGEDVLAPRRAFMLDASEFERVAVGAPTFRTWGEPSLTLDLQIRAEDARAPIGLRHGPIALGDATWTAVDAMAAAFAAGDSIVPHVAPVLASLTAHGIIASAVGDSIQEEPEQLARLWNGLSPLYASQATSASILQVKKHTGLSLRQLARDLKLLTRTFGLPGEGFRAATKVMRLRTAVILLSSPGATATEVAHQVGYKSLEAMGRAFREAGLEPPSVIHAQVRYDAMPSAVAR